MSKKYKYRNKKASRRDWQQLSEDAQLREAYTRFASSVQQAQQLAEARSPQVGKPASHIIDLREAGRILEQHPQLMSFIESVRERQLAEMSARTLPNEMLSVKASPTGMNSQAASLGGWAGYVDRNQPQGVPNARTLRDWSEQSEWVNSAINYYCERIGRADVDCLPYDEHLPFNRGTQKSINLLLDQPNEMGDTWPGLMRMLVRDLLTLGRGAWSKNMTNKRTPTAIYAEDAALVKIYPNWSGNPDEPRYIFDPGGNGQSKIPLRNDEVIMPMYGMSSYKFSLSPVQVLRNTIIADLKATESAARLVDQKPPPHIVQIPGANEQQIRTLRATYDADLAGRREILWLGGPNAAQVKPLVYSLKDQQWMEWMEYLAIKIAVVFGLAAQTFSLTADVNKATASSQQDIEENKGLIPLLLLLEEYLNRQFIADFAPRTGVGRTDINKLNLRILFPEVSETARMMHAEKTIQLATQSLAGLPSQTLNQVLMARGEIPVKGGNTYWTMTTNGPMPWLSYDNEYGDWQPPITEGTMGAQDPEGGPGADDEADSDMGTNEDSSAKDSDVPPAQPSSSDASSGGSLNTTPVETTPTDSTKSYRDSRKSGVAWRPYMIQPTTTKATKSPSKPLLEESEEHKQLTATVTRIFQDRARQAAKDLERFK